ncbi:MAG: HlyD family efflux transporter periplasmic adaptor subunit [Sulfitobacter sp.]|nr:HlyD family efflux transporter periplasmic adaptor subunit [Sulfitobacter sp.]
MDEVWMYASRSLGEKTLTQAQAIQLLAQLYKADVLLTDVSPDTRELFNRQYSSEKRQRLQRWKSPLAIRVPLIDPDRFIVATLPLARKVFSVWGMLFWLFFVGSSVVAAFLHWPELTQNLADRVLAGQNILILLLTFPIVKLFHELGHAYAARINGGEIHEVGIMFLVLMPIPYVDATSSSAFSSRWKRAFVGSAGMLTELFVAAIALRIWLNVESGFISAVAYNSMVIAGVSTLLFNANPLIRFDGYYILSDLIEIPNLGTRSTRYIGYLIQKYLFGIADVKSPANAPGERAWFVGYGISSLIYRLFLISFIVFLLADKYFIIGVILAIWAVIMMAVMPVYKQINYLMTSKRLKGKRTRAIVTTITMVGILIGVTLIPVPFATIVEGVVWTDRESRVRMNSQGFVKEMSIRSGERVEAGQVIIVCDNYVLSANRVRLEAQLSELKAQYDAVSTLRQLQRDRVQVDLVREQINATSAQIGLVDEQIDELTIKSPVSGIFVSFSNQTFVGRFLHRGEVVGIVVKPAPATVRVLVPQDRVNLVRQRTESVTVRMADRIDQVLGARISREVPRASLDLPSVALTVEGGGVIVANPTQASGGSGTVSAFQSWFHFDIEIDRREDQVGLGERVFARFDHGRERFGLQIYRAIRQTFLTRFNV